MTFLASSAACSGSFASARATASHDRYGETSRACVAPQRPSTSALEVTDAWPKKDEDSSDGTEAPDEEPLAPEEDQG